MINDQWSLHGGVYNWEGGGASVVWPLPQCIFKRVTEWNNFQQQWMLNTWVYIRFMDNDSRWWDGKVSDVPSKTVVRTGNVLRGHGGGQGAVGKEKERWKFGTDIGPKPMRRPRAEQEDIGPKPVRRPRAKQEDIGPKLAMRHHTGKDYIGTCKITSKANSRGHSAVRVLPQEQLLQVQCRLRFFRRPSRMAWQHRKRMMTTQVISTCSIGTYFFQPRMSDFLSNEKQEQMSREEGRATKVASS